MPTSLLMRAPRSPSPVMPRATDQRGPRRREVTPLLGGAELAYVCGSARFAEFAENLLVESGLSPEAIRVERFGVTG